MFFCEALTGGEVRRGCRKWRKCEERIFWDAADIAEVLQKGGRHRADLLGDLLVGEGGLVLLKQRCGVTIHQPIFPFSPPLDHPVHSPQYRSLNL